MNMNNVGLYLVRISFLCIILSGCGGGSTSSGTTVTTGNSDPTCGPFSDPRSSEYVLPYPAGTSFFLNQSNCSGFGHGGFFKFGYDFTMDIGTVVTAMRSGMVVHTQDGTADGNRNGTNLILIEHFDGSVALYSHLTRNGVLASVGQSVSSGEAIGRSGNTGNTGGLPHLHVSLHPCIGLPGLSTIPTTNCPSLPFNFRNIEASSDNLAAGQTYTALSN